jgi:hypothetical protein
MNESGDDFDRRSQLNRRSGMDRREVDSVTDDRQDRRSPPATVSAAEGQDQPLSEKTPEEAEFFDAFQEYKSVNNRPFPSWTEILEILKHLGYRKASDTSE